MRQKQAGGGAGTAGRSSRGIIERLELRALL